MEYRIPKVLFGFVALLTIGLYGMSLDSPALAQLGNLASPDVQLYRSYGVIEVTAPSSDDLDLVIPSSIIRQVRSRSAVEDIINEFELGKSARSAEEYRELVDRIREGISINRTSTGEPTEFLEVSCVFDDPRACRDIANFVLRRIIRETLEEAKRERGAYLERLDREIAFYQARLVKANQAVEEFESTNVQYLSFLAGENLSLGKFFPEVPLPLARQCREYAAQLDSYKTERKLLEKEQELIKAEEKKHEEFVVQEQEVDSQDQELTSETKIRNPIIQALDLRYADTIINISLVDEKIMATQVALDKSLKLLPVILKKGREYARLQGEVDRLGDIYVGLIEKKEGFPTGSREYLSSLCRSTFQIIQDAQLPHKPYLPAQVWVND